MIGGMTFCSQTKNMGCTKMSTRVQSLTVFKFLRTDYYEPIVSFHLLVSRVLSRYFTEARFWSVFLFVFPRPFLACRGVTLFLFSCIWTSVLRF
jgi:hypothetical protein